MGELLRGIFNEVTDGLDASAKRAVAAPYSIGTITALDLKDGPG